ncbi:MAG: adenine phosphoribosyltransferase [Fibrobacterales bacterium]
MTLNELKESIRDIPDFPKKGIVFKDITTLLSNPDALTTAIKEMAAPFLESNIDIVVGTEARGFIFAPAIAQILGAGFVPARKPGKLPGPTHSIEYALEYGTDTLEMHTDSFKPGAKVLLVDDLLATGGTIAATRSLVEETGGIVAGYSFLIELQFLNGRDKLGTFPIHSLISY